MVTLELAIDLDVKQINVFPGWTICCNCLEIAISSKGTEENEQNDTVQSDENFELDEQSQKNKHWEELNKILEAICVSPIITYIQIKHQHIRKRSKEQ